MSRLLDPLIYYRASRWLYLRGVPVVPRLLKVFNEIVFHCEIPYTAKIGPGLEVHHRGFGIVVHPRAELGRNVVLSPCITIGGRNGKYAVPKIGNGVFVASGARILGDVTVGDGAVIGANAVVTHSVPARCVAAGVPARVIRENIRTADHTGLEESPSTLPSHPVRTVARGYSSSTETEGKAVRVLLFIQSLEIGGSETQCVAVAERMARAGYAVTIGCLRSNGPLNSRVREAGIPLVVFPTPRLMRPSMVLQMFRFVQFLRKNRFHVVQTNDLYSNLFAVPAARFARVPVVISSQRDLSHWWWYTPRRRKLLRKIQGLSSWLVVNSQAIRADLIAQDGFDARKIRVIHNGIDTEKFAPGDRRSRALLEGVLPSDKLIVMVANMHSPVKGHQELIAAAQTVCRKHPEVRFLLVGDGEMRPEFESQVRDCGLQRSVLFLGHRTDMPSFLPACDIGVLASKAEGLPNAALEYMAAGLATVATHVGGVPEVIQDNVNGLLVHAGNSGVLANAILRLLDDEPLCRRLGLAARNSVIANFDFATVVNALTLLYEGAAGVGPTRVRTRETSAVGKQSSGRKYSVT